MESQQLLTKREVLQNEVFAGLESSDEPTDKVSKQHDHGKITGLFKGRRLIINRLIPEVCKILAKHMWFEPLTAKGSVYHGYLRDKGGNLTTFDVPGAGPFLPPSPSPLFVIPLPIAINLDGTVAESYVDTKKVFGQHAG